MSKSLRLVVLAQVLLAAALPIPSREAAASEPASKETSAGESAVLKRILANWRARQDRIQAFSFAWDSQWIAKRGSAAATETREEFWTDGKGRYRTAAWRGRRPKGPGSKLEFRESTECTFDGMLTRRLSFGPKSAQGDVWIGDHVRPFDEAFVYPFLLAFRAFARGDVDSWSKQTHVISQNAIIGNVHCVKLERRDGGVVDRFWVDPARADIVIASEQSRGGPPGTFIFLEYNDDKSFGWVPARWTQTFDPKGGTGSSTVTRLLINKKFSDDLFTVAFPAGTAVLDKNRLERYVVAPDGSKSGLIKYDSIDTLRILESLEQLTDFTIDPESLKNALEFIAQRYQIKITIDADAVRRGLIDPSIDVKTTTDAIKLKSVLKLILDQSPKPLAYEVRNGTLNVVPAHK